MSATIGGPGVPVSDDDLRRLSRKNRAWKIERDDRGILAVRPTSAVGGAGGEAHAQLEAFAKKAGGKSFDSSTGFKTPRGGVVCPDASWISPERFARLCRGEGYWQMMPDVVIEIASYMDNWTKLKKKIDKYHEEGAAFAVGIEPRLGETYQRGTPPEGLELDIAAISVA